MRTPNPKEWAEMPDGSLRYLSNKTHTDCEVLIIPIEERRPLLSSRVKLAWRNRETGAIAYWLDSRTKFLTPRIIALATAITRARIYYRDSKMLLRIGITDEHDYAPYGGQRW